MCTCKKCKVRGVLDYTVAPEKKVTRFHFIKTEFHFHLKQKQKTETETDKTERQDKNGNGTNYYH